MIATQFVKKELIAVETRTGPVIGTPRGDLLIDEAMMYINYINYCFDDTSSGKDLLYLMPIMYDKNDMIKSVNDLLNKLNDGIIFSKIINLIESNTIDSRAIYYNKNGTYTNEECISNQRLNINAAKSIGAILVYFDEHVLVDCRSNLHMAIGFLWQLIKLHMLKDINVKTYPKLVALLMDGEDIDDMIPLPPDEMLKRWVNYFFTQNTDNCNHDDDDGKVLKLLKNFHTNVKDGVLYANLLNKINFIKRNDELNQCLKMETKDRCEYIISCVRNNAICKFSSFKYTYLIIYGWLRMNKCLDNSAFIDYSDVIRIIFKYVCNSNNEYQCCMPFLVSKDIINGNWKANLIFMSQIFHATATESEQESLKLPPLAMVCGIYMFSV